MNYLLLISLILVLSFGPGKDACVPGFDEYITITLLDKNGMPIPNAQINVTFVIDSAVKPPRIGSVINVTDAGGKAGFRIFNNQQYSTNLDCSVKVEVSLYNHTVYRNNKLITLKNLYPNYQIDLNVPKVKMLFKLDNNLITVDKLILFGNYEYTNVYSFETYVPGEVWGSVIFRNIVRSFNYTKVNDGEQIIFEFVPVVYHIATYDDANQPLRCKAILDSTEYEVNGPTQLKIWNTIVKGQLNCSNKIEKIMLTEYDNRREYRFDVTPPMITDVRVDRIDGDYAILGVTIVDPNQYATGVKEVLFYLNGEQIRPSYVSGSYYYRIPNQDATIKIVAIDMSNNVKEVEARYQRIEQTDTKKEEVKKKDDDPISWFILLVGAGILLGAAIYIYNMYKNVKEE